MEKVVEVNVLRRVYKSSKGVIRRKKIVNEALKGISFSIQKGEIFGLLGPNGAGKTTTIKVLTTLLLPTTGTVSVLGYNVDGGEKEIRKRINFIFGGERSLYWRLSARDNLRYFADLHKIKRSVANERIDKLLKLVGLDNRADEKVETYSKGMKQKLQIARGLINDPEVLFLDEPTIGLDPVAAMDLRKLIIRLRDEGKTILLTTHYMQEADDLCDRIAFIDEGRIIKMGTPEEIKASIENKKMLTITIANTTDTVIDNVKINILDCVVSKKEDATIICINTPNIVKSIDEVKKYINEELFININTRLLTLEDAYLKIVSGDKHE